MCVFKFRWEVCKIKVKKKINVIMTYIIEYAWIYLNVPK